MNKKILLFSFFVFGVFNFYSTFIALSNVIISVFWPLIISVAFWLIDIPFYFPEPSFENSNSEGLWYFFGGWILICAMNSTLTWWFFSVKGIENPYAVYLSLSYFIARIILSLVVFKR